MRRLTLLLVLILLSATTSRGFFGAMSDSSAMTSAQKLWGPHAAIAKFRQVGATYWTTQVGCNDPVNGFLIVAQGKNTWEDAFVKVDPARNGSFRITARATQTDGTTATAAPIAVFACNAIIH